MICLANQNHSPQQTSYGSVKEMTALGVRNSLINDYIKGMTHAVCLGRRLSFIPISTKYLCRRALVSGSGRMLIDWWQAEKGDALHCTCQSQVCQQPVQPHKLPGAVSLSSAVSKFILFNKNLSKLQKNNSVCDSFLT